MLTWKICDFSARILILDLRLNINLGGIINNRTTLRKIIHSFGLFESFCLKVIYKYSNRITLLSLQVINNPKSTLVYSVIYLQIGWAVGQTIY